MATLIDYRGLQVVDPDPTGAGGLAIQNDLKELADRLAASQYIAGLRLSFVSVSSVRVEVGAAIDSGGSFNIALSSPATIDITVSGANGLDTGTEAADTWYAVFVIGDSSGSNPPAGLLSTSAGSPTLPSGYDKFRRVGWVRNNASSNFLKFYQRWTGKTRRYWYDADASAVRVVNNGSATAFQNVSCSAFVPPSSENIVLQIQFKTGTVGLADDRVRLRPTGAAAGTLYQMRIGVVSDVMLMTNVEMPCDTSQSIDYRVTTGGANGNRTDIVIQGFDDEL